MSEASGAEDSPAQTEVSDYPNDTPEADRMSDITMSGLSSPTKIDKAFRYGKSPFAIKKHTSGRGEIRPTRDLSVSEIMRKRKRHNLDKDVSSIVRSRWEESEAESDDSVAPKQHRSRGKRKAKEPPKGFLGGLFHMLEEHPNAPENLYRWIKLLVNFFLVSTLVYIGWSVVDTVRTDLYNANEYARLEITGKIAECANHYSLNGCARKDRPPALDSMCDGWKTCMDQNPGSIMRVKVTMRQVAEIINEFSETMNMKAWVRVLGRDVTIPRLIRLTGILLDGSRLLCSCKQLCFQRLRPQGASPCSVTAGYYA